jgi:F-type H+-transporting ATPase subunit b
MRMRNLAAVLVGLVVCLPAAAAGGGKAPEGINLVKPEYGLIIWTTVTFLLLAFLLSRVAWKPLLGAIEEREKTISESLDGAKRERDEAAKLLDEHKQLVAQSHRERAEVLEQAQKEAERLKDDLMTEARAQKDQMLAKTEEQLQASLEQARNELRVLAADLAVQAAGRLLDRNLDDATQRKLVEEHLADLERRKSSGSSDLPS